MEVDLQAFVNFKHNDRAKLLPMTEFACKNVKMWIPAIYFSN